MKKAQVHNLVLVIIVVIVVIIVIALGWSLIVKLGKSKVSSEYKQFENSLRSYVASSKLKLGVSELHEFSISANEVCVFSLDRSYDSSKIDNAMILDALNTKSKNVFILRDGKVVESFLLEDAKSLDFVDPMQSCAPVTFSKLNLIIENIKGNVYVHKELRKEYVYDNSVDQTFYSIDNSTYLYIPEGTTAILNGDPIDKIAIEIVPVTTYPDSGITPVTEYYVFEPSGVYFFYNDITITISYDPAVVKDPNQIRIMYYDESVQEWLPVLPPYTIDTEKHTVSAQVNHFTAFGAFYSEPAGETGKGGGGEEEKGDEGLGAGAECGNSIKETGEECDDGNKVDGDGCSSKCKNEEQPTTELQCTIDYVSDWSIYTDSTKFIDWEWYGSQPPVRAGVPMGSIRINKYGDYLYGILVEPKGNLIFTASISDPVNSYITTVNQLGGGGRPAYDIFALEPFRDKYNQIIDYFFMVSGIYTNQGTGHYYTNTINPHTFKSCDGVSYVLEDDGTSIVAEGKRYEMFRIGRLLDGTAGIGYYKADKNDLHPTSSSVLYPGVCASSDWTPGEGFPDSPSEVIIENPEAIDSSMHSYSYMYGYKYDNKIYLLLQATYFEKTEKKMIETKDILYLLEFSSFSEGNIKARVVFSKEFLRDSDMVLGSMRMYEGKIYIVVSSNRYTMKKIIVLDLAGNILNSKEFTRSDYKMSTPAKSGMDVDNQFIYLTPLYGSSGALVVIDRNTLEEKVSVTETDVVKNNWKHIDGTTLRWVDYGGVVNIDKDGNKYVLVSDGSVFKLSCTNLPRTQSSGGDFGGSLCGNNIKETGEECDDGNKVDGDGCSSECKKEEQPRTQGQCTYRFERKGSIYFGWSKEENYNRHSTYGPYLRDTPLHSQIHNDKIYVLERGGVMGQRSIIDISDPANPKVIYESSVLSCGDYPTLTGLSSVSEDNKIVYQSICQKSYMIYDVKDVNSFKTCAGVLLGGAVNIDIAKLPSGRYLFTIGPGKGTSGMHLLYADANDNVITQGMNVIGLDNDFCMKNPPIDLYSTGINVFPGNVRIFKHNNRYYLLTLAQVADYVNHPESGAAITLYDITDFSPQSTQQNKGIVKVFEKKDIDYTMIHASAFRNGRIYVMASTKKEKGGEYPFYSLYVYDMQGNVLGKYTMTAKHPIYKNAGNYFPLDLSVDDKYAYIGTEGAGVFIINLETMQDIPLPTFIAESGKIKEGYTYHILWTIPGFQKNGKHYVYLPTYYKEDDGTIPTTVYTSYEIIEECS